MPLGSSSEAPVMRPGPSHCKARKRERRRRRGTAFADPLIAESAAEDVTVR
jgi:hypothetical protein